MKVLKPKGKCYMWMVFMFSSTFLLLLVNLSILLWQTGIPDEISRIDFTNNIQPLLTWTDNTHRSWITVDFDSNFTGKLLSELPKVNDARKPCLSSRTTNISVIGLDDLAARDQPVKLVAGEIYQFVITTQDANGSRRCSGGDYFETDLSSENWKSRPPIKDHGNGNYSMSFQIHPNFSSGYFNLTIVLLFRSFEGFIFPSGPLKNVKSPYVYLEEMRRIPIKFHNNNNVDDDDNTRGHQVTKFLGPPTLPLCQLKDFNRDVWTGRWTRNVWNKECNYSIYDGRYRCIDQNTECVSPWCQGRVGLLESNGWVYSAHCSFHIYSQDEAWKCLNGKHILFWGDSNHMDSVRNLVNFVLGRWEVRSIRRRIYNVTYVNPRNSAESTRITSIYNGHHIENINNLGLDSLRNEGFRELIRRQFRGDDYNLPDVVILNSGLHDGMHGYNVTGFAKAVDYALDFWGDILQGLKDKGKKLPAIFYRTTIATAEHTRVNWANPQKMESFNNIMVEKIKRKGLFNNRNNNSNSNVGSGFIDDFDMKFPWHYSYRCTDGMHYGRQPSTRIWRDGKNGHHYFVDLMLIHVLLNAICHDQQQQW